MGAELLDMLACFALAFATRGRSLNWSPMDRTPSAYYQSMRRLCRAGLVVSSPIGGGLPELRLTEAGAARQSPECRPESWWNRKWTGRWYVLTYDIPEIRRSYRNHFRAFLKRLRLGRLHRSVMVTPVDIRAEFDDLVQGAGAGDYAVLFESRTVLGMPAGAIVRAAWDFGDLAVRHRWYLETERRNRARVQARRMPPAEAVTLAREEMTAYLSVMGNDPLLPRALWPPTYLGEEVYRAHREFQSAIARLL